MPKIFLHSCCAPCGGYVIEALKKQGFEVAVFFYNPNIWPKEEYERRYNVLKHWSKKAGFDLTEGEYNHGKWLKSIKGLENEPEGGKRCLVCYEMRLLESARYAKENGFDCLASTLTIGRNKKAEVINPIGVQAASKYGLKLIEGDWKKQGGQEEACRLSKEEEMYRQDYCGCEFSVND